MIGLSLLLFLSAPGPQPTSPAIGAKVADFTLSSTGGKELSLYTSTAKKPVVVVFIGNECPISNLYLPTLAALQRQFGDKAIQFIAINSNDQDSMETVVTHANERKLPFLVLKDVGHKAADSLGARRTPEAFLLDSEHTIRYRGRIDDQYGYSHRRPTPTRTELKDAIEQLLAGLPIIVPESEVRGCIIGRDKD